MRTVKLLIVSTPRRSDASSPHEPRDAASKPMRCSPNDRLAVLEAICIAPVSTGSKRRMTRRPASRPTPVTPGSVTRIRIDRACLLLTKPQPARRRPLEARCGSRRKGVPFGTRTLRDATSRATPWRQSPRPTRKTDNPATTHLRQTPTTRTKGGREVRDASGRCHR